MNAENVVALHNRNITQHFDINAISKYAVKWMKLENVILTKKNKYGMYSIISGY